ncbi:MAG: pyrroline-5-carboxylate reductase [Clostridia bacterium]|nr:pyrroline-5-carboxylate reductase [Clostridia bacterium]
MAINFAVIGVGNMANAIVAGILGSSVDINKIILFDKNPEQYERAPKSDKYVIASSIQNALSAADVILLSVKPQNYPQALEEIKLTDDFDKKLYISIAAGITSASVSDSLGGACVIRVLPNLPMTVGMGVSVICENSKASVAAFELICSIFRASGSVLVINEKEMNRIISATSSSPAYVFKFIDAIYAGAVAQGLSTDGLLDAICDVFIGSATLLKNSKEDPKELIARVASKGGTTERALATLDEGNIDKIISDAMIACTIRADELGK